MNPISVRIGIAALALTTVLSAADAVSNTTSPAYSGEAAASYLDGRMTWWSTWPVSARDHQTFCVSCHTALPYAMSRPSLRKTLKEAGPVPIEQTFLQNLTKRVRMWEEVEPFYPDATRGASKTAESRGTESVLNSLVLVSYDAASGQLSPDTQLAFRNMWAQQLKTGEDKRELVVAAVS